MGKKERALLAAPREEPRRPRLAQVLEVHRRDHVQKHARGEEPADPLRGQVGDALDVRDEVAVAVPHHVPDLGIVAGRVRLHLPAQPNPVGEELNVRLAHGLERVLPAFPLGGPLEDLERLPEAARDACLEELLLRTEEAEHVRLRDAGLLRDRLRGGTVEAARCELLERRVEHRLASLLGGLPFRADSHGSKLSLTYCHVKGCAVRPAAYLRSLNPQLPLPVWLLQVGGLTNSFGNGLALPFLVIYLHNVRGFSLGTSGLVVAVSSAGQLVAGVLAGPVIDRFGARRTLATGLVHQAVGYGLLPLVRHPWEAFALVALEGAGSAGFWPSQSTLISRLTPTARRHAAFAQQRVTMNLGIGLGGLAAGWIAKVHDPRTFTILFVLDAFTFLAYVAGLALVRDPGVKLDDGMAPASYAAVLRHKTFVGLWALNFLFVTAGYSLLNLLPQFARDHSHVSEREIGLVFAVNTGVIVLAQLPLSRWIEGKRRMRALALMPALWAVAWLLVDGTGAWLDATPAFVAFAIAAGLLGAGE